MKKIIVLGVCIFCMLCTVAQTHHFRWSQPESLSPSFTSPTSSNRSGDFVSGVTFVSGPVEICIDDSDVTDSNQKARFYYGYNTMTVEMRAYPGSIIEVSVPENLTIKEISFKDSNFYGIPLEFSGESGKFSNNIWTAEGSENVCRVPLKVVGTTNCTLTSVTVSDAGMDHVDRIKNDNRKEASKVIWYSASGLSLEKEPSVPGIYLRKEGQTVTKVLVR